MLFFFIRSLPDLDGLGERKCSEGLQVEEWGLQLDVPFIRLMTSVLYTVLLSRDAATEQYRC